MNIIFMVVWIIKKYNLHILLAVDGSPFYLFRGIFSSQ
jgi:hypothetical protein